MSAGGAARPSSNRLRRLGQSASGGEEAAAPNRADNLSKMVWREAGVTVENDDVAGRAK